MKRFIFLVSLVVGSMFAQVTPPLPPEQANASVKDLFQMLDTTFHWSDAGFPETTAVERAQAMNLSWSQRPEDFNSRLSGYNMYWVLGRLFFNDVTQWSDDENNWYQMKVILRERFGVNLDSAEASARGSEKYSLGLYDFVSSKTLEHFSSAAVQTPICILQAVNMATHDFAPSSVIIRQGGKQKISALRTSFESWHEVSSNWTQTDWQVALSQKSEDERFVYTLGIIRFDGGYSSYSKWQPTGFMVSSDYMIGNYYVYQNRYNAEWTDSSGLDHPMWAPATVWRAYPRGDINHSYNLSLGDAVSGANLLLDGKLPSIPHLLDITQDGNSDQNDLLAIFQSVIYGGWGKGRVLASDSVSEGQNPSGTLVVEEFVRDGKPMARLIFEGLPGKSLGLVLENSKFGSFAGDYLKILSVARQAESSSRILRFAENPAAGILLEVEALGKITATPLNGKYFFSPEEEITVVYRSASPTSILEVSAPSEFGLSQNYPNPFNPETVIRFNLPKASAVRLTIYNSLGELVSVLADKEFSPGGHSVVFNGAGLASGIYFYRFQAAGFAETRKMLLTK